MKAPDVFHFFVRAKHWQVFFLVFTPWIVGFAAAAHVPSPVLSLREFGFWGFVFIGSICLQIIFLVCWLGSVGSFLQSILKPRLKMRRPFFDFSLVYPVIYVPVFIPLLFSNILRSPAFTMPLHLICMVCLFYLIYFVAKSLTLAEHQQPVTFYQCAGPFFLLWFFPLGICFIQPKINKLEADH